MKKLKKTLTKILAGTLLVCSTRSYSADSTLIGMTKVVPELRGYQIDAHREIFTRVDRVDRIYLVRAKLKYVNGENLLAEDEGYVLMIERGKEDGTFYPPENILTIGNKPVNERVQNPRFEYNRSKDCVDVIINLENGREPIVVHGPSLKPKIEKEYDRRVFTQ